MKLNGMRRGFYLAALLMLAMTACALAQETPLGGDHPVSPDAATARLGGKNYELTIDQVYCDGRKLYYSYLLTMAGQSIEPLEGEKIDYAPWDEAYPGERFEDVMFTFLGEGADRQIAQWLDSHERAYIEVDYTAVGDGAELTDGTSLSPVDSGMTRVDDKTMMAFYEVELPQDYAAGETIDFVLNVLTTTTAYYQDETGVYATRRYQPEKLVRVPVTAPVTGQLTILTGTGLSDGYPAEAKLFVSDVDVSGTIRFFGPEDYIAEGYVLEAGGERLRSFEPTWTRYDGEAHVMQLRFDLPQNMSGARLVPLDPTYAYEAIELKEQGAGK